MVGAVASLAVRAAPLLTFVAAAWVIGRVAQRDAPRFGLPRPAVAVMTSSLAITALVAARIAYVAPHWSMIVAHPLDLLRVTDGLSLPGGLLGAVGAVAFFGRRAHLPIARVADLYGTALPLGVAIYGLGCLLRDDCFGRAAPPPFGIVFPGLQMARYPVELYAAAIALLIWAGLQTARAWIRVPGTLALLAIASLAVARLVLDELRLQVETRSVSADQQFSLGVALLALAALCWRWVWERHRSRVERVKAVAGPSPGSDLTRRV